MSLVKKTLNHPKAKEDERSVFMEKIERFASEGRPVVYIDESGFIKDALRSYGYSKKGSTCVGMHDWHGRTAVQAIGALLKNSLLCVGLFSGTVNGSVFTAWVEQTLLPSIPTSSVVVMDNASFHKVSGVTKLIEKHGHILEYLPAYSPDLNPIEKKWAEVKSKRKELRTNDIDGLFKKYFL